MKRSRENSPASNINRPVRRNSIQRIVDEPIQDQINDQAEMNVDSEQNSLKERL